MHFKNFILVGFLSLVCSIAAFAQDFHYTQYFQSPLGVNPALAGAFNGSYRINGVYRSQYWSTADRAFNGFSLNVDAPIIRGIRKQDWVGVGLRIESATAGAADQKLNFYGLGAAYHLSLDKKQTRILSLGVQYGTGGYSYTGNELDQDAFGSYLATKNLSDQASAFNGTGGDMDETGGSLNDLTVGVLYNVKNPKTGADFKIGIGVEGLLNPDRASKLKPTAGAGTTGGSFSTEEDNKGIGINAFSSYEFAITRRASLTSGMYYYTNKKASALNVNSIMNYKMKPGNELTLHAGLGLRSVRAGLIYLGATIKDIRVGLAYDIDISSAVPGSNGQGGAELAVSYIGKIYKKPKPKPIIYCPRL